MTEEQKTTKAKTIANEITSNIDKLLDDVKSNLKFRLLNYLDDYIINIYKHKNTRVRQDVCREVFLYYENKANELERALNLTKTNIENEEDQQIYEAYSSFKKNDIRNMYNFVNQILIDCEQIRSRFKEMKTNNQRKQRNFYSNKERILKKIEYCEESPEYNLKSFPVENIFLYSTILAFDHVKNNVILYESIDGKPLEMRGVTFINATARRKNLRTDTRKHLEKLMNANKNTVGQIFSELNRKEFKMAKRLNANVLLLKGFKK